jgi:predicted restriction endonuclease
LLPTPLSKQLLASVGEFAGALEVRFPEPLQGDAAAERSEVDPSELQAFLEQIGQKNYAVADATATVKTRGSAQRAFAEAVKANYEYRCAITGIVTTHFLVASHIVPWSLDQSIRLDPANGICLSLIVDRALERGYLLIEDDLTIRIDWSKVGPDNSLRSQLESYDGRKMATPTKEAPRVEYLQRRRALVLPTD